MKLRCKQQLDRGIPNLDIKCTNWERSDLIKERDILEERGTFHNPRKTSGTNYLKLGGPILIDESWTVK